MTTGGWRVLKLGEEAPAEAQPWNKSSPVWDGDLINYLHTRKALCSGNEITRGEAVGQLNEVNLKSVCYYLLPASGT